MDEHFLSFLLHWFIWNAREREEITCVEIEPNLSYGVINVLDHEELLGLLVRCPQPMK